MAAAVCCLAHSSDVAAAVVARGYAEQLVDWHSPILLGLRFDNVFVVLQKEKEIPCSMAAPSPSANFRYLVGMMLRIKVQRLDLRRIKGSRGLRASYCLSEAA